jgi:hypothetical protein
MFSNVLKVILGKFGEKAKVFDLDLPLFIIDFPGTNEKAKQLIKDTMPKEYILDFLEGLDFCERQMWDFLRKGESTAYSISLIYMDLDKDIPVFKGIIVKPHLQEINTLWTSGAETKHFTYVNMDKMFGFFIHDLIILRKVEQIGENKVRAISQELVQDLLKMDNTLTYQSRSVVQPLADSPH